MPTPEPVPIRPAAPDDAAALAALGAETFHETFEGTAPEDDLRRFLAETYSPARQAAELADPAVQLFVAEAAGRLVGYAMLRAGPPPAEVDGPAPVELARLYVRRSTIGAGLGHRLLARALDEARGRGFRTVWLGVWEHNHRALAFYARHGFRDVGAHTFMVGGDAQRDRLMAAPL